MNMNKYRLIITTALMLVMASVTWGQSKPKPVDIKPTPPTAPAAAPGPAAAAAPAIGSIPIISPLSHEEEEDIRTAQIDVRDAAASFIALQEKTNRELLQSTEYRRQQDAVAVLGNAVSKIFANRHLTPDKEASLCDGPDQRPACSGMTKRKLELRPVPTPAADADKAKK